MTQDDQIGFIRNTRVPSHSSPFRRRLSIATKPESFRQYLKRHDVMEMLTKKFHKLLIERPTNPLDYFIENERQTYEMEELKRQLAEAKEKIEELQVQNSKLRKTSHSHQ